MTDYQNRTVFLNGDYMFAKDAKLSIFDRGLLFADAVYEGLGLMDGKIADFELHMQRLERSLAELEMPNPLAREAYRDVFQRLATENDIQNGFFYLQITRGTADRNYLYSTEMQPNVFAFVQPQKPVKERNTHLGVKMHAVPDLRWKRRDIKTTNLLGQVMAKKAAHDAGAFDALLVDADGRVTEAASRSFFIVKDNTIIAPPVTEEILHGITRQVIVNVAETDALETAFRWFTLDDVLAADEAFLTGSSTTVVPVIQIDEHIIGDGKPGKVALRLREEYLAMTAAS